MGGGAAPDADGDQAVIGGGRRGLERTGTVAGVPQSFRRFVRPIDTAMLCSEGRRSFLRFMRSYDNLRSRVLLAGAT